mgnify:CR=1 FL=1
MLFLYQIFDISDWIGVKADDLIEVPPLRYMDQRSGQSLPELMQFFGQKNKQWLSTDSTYWSEPCNVTHHEALSALSRAKSDQCRKEITSISCLNEQNALFPDFIPK